jgi:hypothetical protein
LNLAPYLLSIPTGFGPGYMPRNVTQRRWLGFRPFSSESWKRIHIFSDGINLFATSGGAFADLGETLLHPLLSLEVALADPLADLTRPIRYRAPEFLGGSGCKEGAR